MLVSGVEAIPTISSDKSENSFAVSAWRENIICLTSTLSQRKGRAPQPSITFSCQAGEGGFLVLRGGLWCGGGGPPHQWWRTRDSIRPIRLTVTLDLKTTAKLGREAFGTLPSVVCESSDRTTPAVSVSSWTLQRLRCEIWRGTAWGHLEWATCFRSALTFCWATPFPSTSSPTSVTEPQRSHVPLRFHWEEYKAHQQSSLHPSFKRSQCRGRAVTCLITWSTRLHRQCSWGGGRAQQHSDDDDTYWPLHFHPVHSDTQGLRVWAKRRCSPEQGIVCLSTDLVHNVPEFMEISLHLQRETQPSQQLVMEINFTRMLLTVNWWQWITNLVVCQQWWFVCSWLRKVRNHCCYRNLPVTIRQQATRLRSAEAKRFS